MGGGEDEGVGSEAVRVRLLGWWMKRVGVMGMEDEGSELDLRFGGGSPGVGVDSAKCTVKLCVGKVGACNVVIFCSVGMSCRVGMFRSVGMLGMEETLCKGIEGIMGTLGLLRGLEGLLERGVGVGLVEEERGVGEGSVVRGPRGVAIGS